VRISDQPAGRLGGPTQRAAEEGHDEREQPLSARLVAPLKSERFENEPFTISFELGLPRVGCPELFGLPDWRTRRSLAGVPPRPACNDG
jgi:hypothetical protein